MPLHLLHKKSWNVYNPEVAARVRRDEEAAKAKEREEERRREDADADQRLALLREETDLTKHDTLPHKSIQSTKKRKRHDDDDIIARESVADRAQRLSGHEQINKTDQMDQNRHPRGSTADNDVQGMRFSDAAGYGKSKEQPWYNTSVPDLDSISGRVAKDVWGNEDPRRVQRESQRMNANDPLAAMKKGIKQLKQAEHERADWKAQRERDLTEIEHIAALEYQGRRTKTRRRRGSDVDSLEGFSLDDHRNRQDRTDKTSRTHRRHHHHHHQRESSKHNKSSRSKERHRSQRSRREQGV